MRKFSQITVLECVRKGVCYAFDLSSTFYNFSMIFRREQTESQSGEK